MNPRLILILVAIAVSVVILLPVIILFPTPQPLANKQTVERVKQQYESELMAIDGVVGVGISECAKQPCLQVYLTTDSPSLKQQIPTQLNGFRVETQVTGIIQALPQKER